jgi:DNA-binding transcriptional LysR family regulator
MYVGETEGVQTRRLLQAPMGLLASPDMPLPREISTLEDLSHIPMVRLANGSFVAHALGSAPTPVAPYFDSTVVVTTMPAVLSMVGSGHVATIVSGIAASHPQARQHNFFPLPGLLPTAHLCTLRRPVAAFNAEREHMHEIIRRSVLETDWHPSVTQYTDDH